MSLKRRAFLNLASGAAVLATASACTKSPTASSWADGIISKTEDVLPISSEERALRVATAQKLMKENNLKAIILDTGSTLTYFTGVNWWPSERAMLTIIPAKGKSMFVCPAFEEARMREMVGDSKVYAWQEDESPYEVAAIALNESGVTTGNIGMDEQLRFFIYEGIKKAAPNLNLLAAAPVTIQCRIKKSAAEIALMQRAFDITVEAIKIALNELKVGMSNSEVSGIVKEAHELMGAEHDFALVLFGKASALPHGTREPQILKKGDIVLMDCGCKVKGYSSDISRTIVFGAEPTEKQTEIWNLEKKAQLAGFNAAQLGAACGNVDVASRKVIEEAGFGPGYELPGLPHRTGHGIGMDGHEWGNMVKGNKRLLEIGMCFSIEPTVAIPGEFGVRLEDCVFMTGSGPKWFVEPSASISEPFG